MNVKEIRNAVIVTIIVWKSVSVVADVVLDIFWFMMYS